MIPIRLEYPEDFLKDEIISDYQVSSQMKEIWAIELDLLERIDEICSEHNIRYYASGGTLLGAVRHKGFIPWDDDIDIAMPREDYKRFCALADKFSDPYELQFYGKTEGYFTGHAQLRNRNTVAVLRSACDKYYRIPYNQGIFVDIFPLDAIPDNEELRVKQAETVKKYRSAAIKLYRVTEGYIPEKATIKRKILHAVCSLLPERFSYRHYYEMFLKECERYNGTKTEYVTMLSFMPDNMKLRIKSEYLGHPVRVPFEFTTIQTEENSDAVLRVQYGDYTVPVKGGCYHGGVIFDTNVPYETWKKQGHSVK